MNSDEQELGKKNAGAIVSRGLLAGGNLRIFAVKADGLVAESMERHRLSPLAALETLYRLRERSREVMS